jgi:hypothetical protein
MIDSKIADILHELKELKDANSKAAVESAAKRAGEIIRELELNAVRSRRQTPLKHCEVGEGV